VTWTGDQRRAAPRIEAELDVTLSRKIGNPVDARTVDLCTTGMRVTSKRPLHVDELLRFDLVLDAGLRVDGVARVVREHALNIYALRVESVGAGAAELLSRFVAAALEVIPTERSQAGS
jgi:hypothetical protein